MSSFEIDLDLKDYVTEEKLYGQFYFFYIPTRVHVHSVRVKLEVQIFSFVQNNGYWQSM